MWFAKWFGGREESHEDDEPARFSAPTLVRPAQEPAKPAAAQRAGIKKPAKGFDPYNSGAFKKTSAWERVTRR